MGYKGDNISFSKSRGRKESPVVGHTFNGGINPMAMLQHRWKL
jgi:hypothetical protein